jgi:hypothetical protein
MAYAVSAKVPAYAHLTDSLADVYTCPAGKIAEVQWCEVGNVDGAADASVSIAIYDASSEGTFYPVKLVNVPMKSSYTPFSQDGSGPVLEAGDKIQALASASGDLDICLKIVEFTPPAA